MLGREELRETVLSYEELIRKENPIEREILPELEKSLKFEEVSVIAGVRRSGKTFVLYSLAKKYGGVYINFEDERLINFDYSDFEKLLSIINEKKEKILYLDEVQNVKGWEKFASRINRRVKVFVSGSNSKLLCSEFSTALTGRTITYIIRPLAFREFLLFRKIKTSDRDELRSQLEKYIDLGGFPRVVLTNQKRLAAEYFNRILYRDIIPRFSIKKPDSLHKLAVFLISNVGSRFSYRKLKDYCGLDHESTVKGYIFYLTQAFLLDVVNKYSPSLRIQEANPKKVYAVDTAFSTILPSSTVDRTRLFENIIYNELKSYQRYNIFYEQKKREVDFLLADNMRPVAGINASYEINDKKTFARETEGLVSLKKGIKKFLITLYPPSFEIESGITYLSAIDFLLKKSLFNSQLSR
ncbi:MAG: ATP-binding protein [Candidatus Anstonellales archaeon]